MAFNIGELLARLRFDTRDFEKGVARADQGFKRIEQSAARTEGTVRRTARSTSAYANVQRLTASDIKAASDQYDRMFMSMDDAHAQALKMNAAFNAQRKAVSGSTAGLSRLNYSLASVARQAVGAHPAVGQLANVLGSMAIGTALTAGVLAGIAAISFAVRKMGEDAREAREKLEAAIDRLEELREQRSLPVGGQTALDVEATRREIEALTEEQRKLVAERDSLSGIGGAGARDPVRYIAINRQLEEMGDKLGRLRHLANVGADAVAEEAAERERNIKKMEEEIAVMRRRADELNRAIQIDMAGRTMLTGAGGWFQRMRTGQEPGGPLTGQNVGVPLGGHGAYNRRVFDDVFGDFAQGAQRTAKEMKRLTVDTGDAASALDDFGDGLGEAFSGAFDLKQIGSQLAAQGLGALFSTAADVIFGDRYVTALQENTRALQRMSGIADTLPPDIEQYLRARGFGDMLDDARNSVRAQSAFDLARRRIGAQDIEDPAAQFDALLGALMSGVSGSGPFGIGGLRGSLGQLTPDNIDSFLNGILDQIEAGTFDVSQLQGLSLEEFLDILAELESLGDAAAEAADGLGALTDAVRNAPTGYRVALARYHAQTPMAAGANAITISGPVTVRANNPGEFYREMEREARRQSRRGGTTDLQVSTSPRVQRGS